LVEKQVKNTTIPAVKPLISQKQTKLAEKPSELAAITLNHLKYHQTGRNQAEPTENTTKLAGTHLNWPKSTCIGQNTPTEKERNRPALVNKEGVTS
jgi:hypothetical protein